MFSQEEITKLPEHSKYDHKIEFVKGTTAPWGPLYSMNDRELKELRTYLDRELKAGKIRPSNSPCSSPMLFVPKPDGSLRPCVDYRKINAITIKNHYPLPLMGELRELLRSARIFTKIDLKNDYNLVRIAPGDEWKTAFKT